MIVEGFTLVVLWVMAGDAGVTGVGMGWVVTLEGLGEVGGALLRSSC